MIELLGAKWRKSTRSQANGDCVEMADLGERIAIRDSKNASGPTLCFTRNEWLKFIAGIKGGSFER